MCVLRCSTITYSKEEPSNGSEYKPTGALLQILINVVCCVGRVEIQVEISLPLIHFAPPPRLANDLPIFASYYAFVIVSLT